jgi:hypothetical protein
MNDYKARLLIEMALKVREAGTYNLIRLITSLLWLIEFFYVFFGYGSLDIFYLIIAVICLASWFHMDKKYKTAISEYDELKKEYIEIFEDETK